MLYSPTLHFPGFTFYLFSPNNGIYPILCFRAQNVVCTQYVVKHNLVLDGMLIY